MLTYVDTHALTQSVDQYLGLFWVFIALMIILGAILAFAVIYVTMAVNVVERTNELATLRTAGVPLRRVAGTLATENLLATALGVPLGLILGVLAARAFLDTFSSDLFHFALHLDWWTLPASAPVCCSPPHSPNGPRPAPSAAWISPASSANASPDPPEAPIGT